MQIINLVDLDKSDIKYKISSFPDGQHQVDIDLTTVNFEELLKISDNEIKRK